MEIRRRLLALLFVLPIVCALSLPASAHPVPDLDRSGSISVTMCYQGNPVPGGTLTLYRAGDVAEDDGNYSFTLSADFADSRLPLEDLSADLAQKLAQYASSQKLTGTTKTINSEGEVLFGNLKPGLYLLVQNQAASGYNKAAPFLVSVPMLEDGKYVYDVDAGPKVDDLVKKPTTSDTKLPQTGQVNWPIPVLVILGLGLFSAGWMLRFGKKDEYER